ncbi:hypothetical protein JCM8547_004148 [Rhodosporidiobolus lusitaniae]
MNEIDQLNSIVEADEKGRLARRVAVSLGDWVDDVAVLEPVWVELYLSALPGTKELVLKLVVLEEDDLAAVASMPHLESLTIRCSTIDVPSRGRFPFTFQSLSALIVNDVGFTVATGRRFFARLNAPNLRILAFSSLEGTDFTPLFPILPQALVSQLDLIYLYVKNVKRAPYSLLARDTPVLSIFTACSFEHVKPLAKTLFRTPYFAFLITIGWGGYLNIPDDSLASFSFLLRLWLRCQPGLRVVWFSAQLQARRRDSPTVDAFFRDLLKASEARGVEVRWYREAQEREPSLPLVREFLE